MNTTTRIVFLFLSIVFTPFLNSAKTLHYHIPDFLKAVNANFVVCIMTNDEPIKRNGDVLHINLSRAEDKLAVSETDKINVKYFKQTAKYIYNRLHEIGLKPSAFSSIGASGLNKSHYLEHIAPNLPEQPGYLILLSPKMTEAEFELIKTNSLVPEKLTTGRLIIKKVNTLSFSNSYPTPNKPLSLEKCLNLFAKKISNKKNDYFTEEMKILTMREKNEDEKEEKREAQRIVDAITKVTVKKETFPKEENFKRRAILIVHNSSNEDVNETNKMEKFLNKRYPYRFKLLSYDEALIELKEVDYKWIIYAENFKLVLHQRNSSGVMQQLTYYQYCYYLKDVETETAYYGISPNNAINRAVMNDVRAIKRLVKNMEEHYGWK